MPIYEYRCEACGHRLDALQKIADDPLTDCPSCSEAALRRLVSAPNFRLAGKGWYETDFKSDKETRRNLADRPEESSAGQEQGETGKRDGESEKAAGDAKKGCGFGGGEVFDKVRRVCQFQGDVGLGQPYIRQRRRLTRAAVATGGY